MLMYLIGWIFVIVMNKLSFVMRWRNLSSCWFVIANLPFLNEKTSMKDQWWKVLLELQTLVPLCSSQQMYLIVFVFVAMMQHDDYQCNRSSHNHNYCIRCDDHISGDFVNDNCILASNLKWQQIASLWRVVLRFWKRKPLLQHICHLQFQSAKIWRKKMHTANLQCAK